MKVVKFTRFRCGFYFNCTHATCVFPLRCNETIQLLVYSTWLTTPLISECCWSCLVSAAGGCFCLFFFFPHFKNICLICNPRWKKHRARESERWILNVSVYSMLNDLVIIKRAYFNGIDFVAFFSVRLFKSSFAQNIEFTRNNSSTNERTTIMLKIVCTLERIWTIRDYAFCYQFPMKCKTLIFQHWFVVGTQAECTEIIARVAWIRVIERRHWSIFFFFSHFKLP